MSRVQDEPGFVLHRRNYSETSLLLEVFTRTHGRSGLLARAARGSKSALPALLQPFQRLTLDYAGSGELPLLRRAEAAGPTLLLRGEAALAGLYYNELLMRLLPRNDAHARLFDAYTVAVTDLVDCASLSFSVRRFERALLDELGYGIDFAADVAGQLLVAERRYELDTERGFSATNDATGYSGRALLAMAGSIPPAPAELTELRRLFRRLIQSHLTGAPLHSWSLMSELRS